MPAMFFVDDEALAKMRTIHDRLEKLLDRVIPHDEDMFDAFIELLDQLENHVDDNTPILTAEYLDLGNNE